MAEVGVYAQFLAKSVGVVFVLLVLGYVYQTRNTGRERDEADHEKAVNKGLRKLSRTRLIQIDEPGAGFRHYLEWLAEHGEAVNRRKRVKQWVLRRHPRRIDIHGAPIEDADGRTIHVISIDGRRLAHRNLTQLTDDVETVAEALVRFETPPATMSERYYQNIVDGFVDVHEARARVRGDCHTRIESNMRRNKELDYEDLYDRFVFDPGFRYPPEILEAKLDELEGRIIRQKKDGTITYNRFT